MVRIPPQRRPMVSEHTREAVLSDPEATTHEGPETVSREELNSWRRGLTPQAEIWNGRLAMLGLSVGITVLIIARLAGSLGS